MKHMEEMKIAGISHGIMYRDAGNLYRRPKGWERFLHLTAIPDNNAAEPVTDSTSEGTADADFSNLYRGQLQQ